MKLRTQIFLSHMPIIGVVFCIVVLFIFILRAVQEKVETIFDNDLNSILAMQRINKNFDQLNSHLKLNPQSALQHAPAVSNLENLIEEQLLIQEKNVKGTVERDLTEVLQKKWQNYLKAIHSKPFSPQSKSQTLFTEINKITNDIIGWNEDELVRLKGKLANHSSNVAFYITLGIILSLALGLYFSWYLAGVFLRPLGKLAATIKQMGLEDKTTLMHIKGSDEINKLCAEFNSMTRRLEDYHRSSLGKLKKTHRTLRSGFDSLPCPTILLDTHTNIVYANKLAHQLSKQLKKAPSLFHLKGDWKNKLIELSNQAVDTKQPYMAEKEKEKITVIKNNKKVFLLPWVFPILKGDKDHRKVEGILIVLQDLVQGHMMDSTQSEAYEAIAHEIQPILVDLHMALHLCLQQEIGSLNEKQEDVLQSAREKCDILEKLSHDLSNISKASHQKKKTHKENIDINPIILKLIQDHALEAEEKKSKIIYQEPPYSEKVHGDPQKITTLIENLLRNAVHYAAPKSDVTIRLQDDNDKLLLEVNNKGTTIPLKYRKDIFKKDFALPGQKDERRGLGLYAVQKIVDGMKGTVGVRSNSAQGTTFWVSLPIVKEGKNG